MARAESAPMNHPFVAVSSAPELVYRAYSNIAEIDQISEQWGRLLDASACNRAFASVQWYLGSARTDKYEGCDPLVIAAFRGPDLVGLLPLVVDSRNNSATIPIYVCDYCDVITLENDLEPVEGMLSYALSLHDRLERILVGMVASDSNFGRALPLLAACAQFECRYRPTGTHRYIALTGSIDGYLASKSQKFRKNLKRARRAVSARALTVKELRPGEFDPVELPELCLSMILARHKDGFFVQARGMRSFLAQVFPPLFIKQAIRAFAVMSGDRVIALDLCMSGRRSLGAWNGGFLPEAAEWSPGAILFAFGIEKAIDSGLSEYDFLKGDEPYKSRWANMSRMVGEIELTARR